MLLHQPITHQS